MSEREQMNPLEEFRDPCDCDPSCGEDCMADAHALYAMANEIMRLRSQLAQFGPDAWEAESLRAEAAERERDEARREREVLRNLLEVSRKFAKEAGTRAERAERDAKLWSENTYGLLRAYDNGFNEVVLKYQTTEQSGLACADFKNASEEERELRALDAHHASEGAG